MVTPKIISKGLLRALVTVLITILILYFAYIIQTVIIYLIVSLILALIANPLVQLLEKKLKLSSTFAAIITILVFILVVTGFILLFVPLIISQANNLALLDTNNLQLQFLDIEHKLENYFNVQHISLNELATKANLTSKINFSFFTNFINATLNFLANFGMGLVSVFFITFFFIKDQKLFKENARRLLPDTNEDKILHSISKINHLLTRYFIGLLLQLTVVFVLYLIVLMIFGTQNIFIIAFVFASI